MFSKVNEILNQLLLAYTARWRARIPFEKRKRIKVPADHDDITSCCRAAHTASWDDVSAVYIRKGLRPIRFVTPP